MDFVLFISENATTIVAVMTVVGGIVGKYWSDHANAKEVAEAKAAAVATAVVMAPVVDLAYNIAKGGVAITPGNLTKLAKCASDSWASAKVLSKEVNDVLTSMEP